METPENRGINAAWSHCAATRRTQVHFTELRPYLSGSFTLQGWVGGHSDVQTWAAWQLRDIGWDLKALSPLYRSSSCLWIPALSATKTPPHPPTLNKPPKDPLTHTAYSAVDTPGVEATCQSWKEKTTSLCNCPGRLKQTIQQVILASLLLIERSQTQRLKAHRAWCPFKVAPKWIIFHSSEWEHTVGRLDDAAAWWWRRCWSKSTLLI